MIFVKNQPSKVAITGLGGVGKTQIALESAFQTRERYPECSIFWIPATNEESLQQAYLALGRQLGIPDLEEEQADVKRLVQRHLSQETAGRWLLIFDNADNLDMWVTGDGSRDTSHDLKDYLPRSSQGCLMFTTRSRKIAVKLTQGNVIEVSEMDEEEATQLLGKSLINQNLVGSGQDTVNLLKQLTFLPLAITQAAAYINENGITLSDYSLLLNDQEPNVIELLSEYFEDEGRYRDAKNPVATTWLISFEQIRRLDPLAAEYLSFMSCVDPREIPLSLLPPPVSEKGDRRDRNVERVFVCQPTAGGSSSRSSSTGASRHAELAKTGGVAGGMDGQGGGTASRGVSRSRAQEPKRVERVLAACPLHSCL